MQKRPPNRLGYTEGEGWDVLVGETGHGFLQFRDGCLHWHHESYGVTYAPSICRERARGRIARALGVRNDDVEYVRKEATPEIHTMPDALKEKRRNAPGRAVEPPKNDRDGSDSTLPGHLTRLKFNDLTR
jgi:hypothetical protein